MPRGPKGERRPADAIGKANFKLRHHPEFTGLSTQIHPGFPQARAAGFPQVQVAGFHDPCAGPAQTYQSRFPQPIHRLFNWFSRHCEERSDEAIHSFLALRHGLLRFARNDDVAT